MALPSAKTRRLILIAMVTVAAALFAIAVLVYRGNPGPSSLPAAIQSVSPERGSNVLTQTDITVDLAVGYTAELEINGFAIPEGQLDRVPGLNQVNYRPTVGKVVPSLRADQNCVTVNYWLLAQTSDNAQSYTWCFDAS